MKKLLLIALAGLISVQCLAQMNHEQMKKPAIGKAIALLYPTKGSHVHGVVTFEVVEQGVRVVAHVEGLTPGKHGFHIHEFGDCSTDDGSAAGGHFNPTAMQHSMPMSEQRHVGDLGNIEAGKDGKAHLDYVDSMLKFDGATSILGRGVI
ncbi:MAG: superoxide dismutase family protein, partial [Bacteroidota bacterium]